MDNLDREFRSMLRQLFGSDDKHKVYVVNGAPASGKTSYVLSKRQPGDLVLDLDMICAALGGTDKLYEDHKPYLDVALAVRDVVLDKIDSREGKWKNAYVITASSDSEYVRSLADRLGAEIVMMNATKEQCRENALKDERRSGCLESQSEIIDRWFSEKAGGAI